VTTFVASFGTVNNLAGAEITVAVPGLLTTDACFVSLISTPPSGFEPLNARCVNAGVLSIWANPASRQSLTLNNVSLRLVIIRPA
jgi:hypothetical protein